VSGGPTEDGAPAWSPDGRQIAFDRCGVRRGATCHLWVKDLATGQLWQLTSGRSFDVDPAWSPDGRRIAFASLRAGRWNISTIRAAGGGQVQITRAEPGGVSVSPSWSPDGTWIAFEGERNGPFNIFAVRALVSWCAAAVERLSVGDPGVLAGGAAVAGEPAVVGLLHRADWTPGPAAGRGCWSRPGSGTGSSPAIT
jgi:WD40-like Beta Propeller Repeat